MSMVTVHGPYTMYSKGVVQNATGTVSAAATNPANGLVWTFTPRDLSQVAANYDWAYTGLTGVPATPIADTKTPTITFSGAGTAVVTLTLNGVAQPPITVTAVAGTAPREGDPEPPPEAPQALSAPAPEEPTPDLDAGFDPAAHTVTEVIGFVEDNPDQRVTVLELEREGKNRVTLVQHLEEMA